MERSNTQVGLLNLLPNPESLQIFKAFVGQLDGYGFFYEEKHLMNVITDDAVFPCVYVEEFRQGTIALNQETNRRRMVETSKMVIRFMAIATESGQNIDLHENACVRESMREKLKSEAVLPFIEMYNNAVEYFIPIDVWGWATPPPQFDVNEVSVDLIFECKRLMQCR